MCAYACASVCVRVRVRARASAHVHACMCGYSCVSVSRTRVCPRACSSKEVRFSLWLHRPYLLPYEWRVCASCDWPAARPKITYVYTNACAWIGRHDRKLIIARCHYSQTSPSSLHAFHSCSTSCWISRRTCLTMKSLSMNVGNVLWHLANRFLYIDQELLPAMPYRSGPSLVFGAQ